jgi:hypothetical protein
VLRAGVRYIGLGPNPNDKKKPFEAWDLELEGTYETWGSSGDPTVVTVNPATQQPSTIALKRYWQNTFSIRAGGAYNIPVGDAVLTARAGTYFDSATTDQPYTRLDVNSLTKMAGTLGIGYRTGAFTANLAYAAVGSFSRLVDDGAIRLTNTGKDGQPVDGNGKQLPIINNGEYRAFAHIVSIGVEVNFEKFWDPDRKSTFGDPTIEDLATPEKPPEKAPEKAPPKTSPKKAAQLGA